MQKFIPFAESSCQNSTFCNCLGGNRHRMMQYQMIFIKFNIYSNKRKWDSILDIKS